MGSECRDVLYQTENEKLGVRLTLYFCENILSSGIESLGDSTKSIMGRPEVFEWANDSIKKYCSGQEFALWIERNAIKENQIA